MTNERTRTLLLLLATLVAVRFVLLPWRESQDESLERLQVLTDRLDRSEAVYANRELINKSLAKLEKSTEGTRARFPDAADEAAFRLQQQQAVSGKLEAVGLPLSEFNWVVGGELADANLRFSRFRLQTSGDVGAIARFVSSIETTDTHLLVRELTLTPVNAQQISLGSSSTQLTMLVDAYYR
jgi:hypothetical protein